MKKFVIKICILFVILFLIFPIKSYGKELEKRVLTEYLEFHGGAIATEYDLDWNLVKAVLFLESRYNIKRETYNYDKKGNIISTDKGLAQINNQWLEWYGRLAEIEIPDPFNPIHSIKMCCAGLNYWKERASKYVKNEEELIIYYLNFYNVGEQGFLRYVEKHDTIDRAYSDRILEFKAMLDEYGYILD